MAEVVKPSLIEKVYANKNCGNGQQECLTSLCILKQDENNLILKYSNNNFKIFYSASKKPNNSIASSLIIYRGNNNNGAIPMFHTVDKSDEERYKYYSHKGVIEEAEKLLNRNDLNSNFIAEETMLENLILDIKNNEPALTLSELTKSIFYHVSIIKTVKRAIENNTANCNCAPVPFYFVDKSPFLCQEDLFYNVNEILNTLEENYTIISQEYSPETIISAQTYFENKKLAQINEVSFEEAYINLSEGVSTNEFVIYLDELIDGPQEAAVCLLYGSDPGCCGNYSGCCWYADILCLYHDLACWCCGSLACFSGCVSSADCN